ncbi:SDS hydrolase SdsA1 [Pseudomonas aeruginosa]|nr:SDS hydrolase SdsA1 [Pseudomonas aeruginosa]
MVEVVNRLVFAEPDNRAARELQADALEQLGYQAENAGWRNSYLSAAYELRHGVPRDQPTMNAGSADALAAMDTGLLFDYLGVRLDAGAAEGKALSINLRLPDIGEDYLLELKNSHLNNLRGVQSEDAGQTVSIDRADLNRLLLKEVSAVRPGPRRQAEEFRQSAAAGATVRHARRLRLLVRCRHAGGEVRGLTTKAPERAPWLFSRPR